MLSDILFDLDGTLADPKWKKGTLVQTQLMEKGFYFFDVGDGDWGTGYLPRIARMAPRDHVFHILSPGNNRQDIFRDEIDYQKYLGVRLRRRMIRKR